mmetsp:Transcript_60137/g.178317  ORF Transcript_60137/g.178317 Transcript_60137/m.178317 type:complete len:229 (-) Transcript_60137:15-701(-)
MAILYSNPSGGAARAVRRMAMEGRQPLGEGLLLPIGTVSPVIDFPGPATAAVGVLGSRVLELALSASASVQIFPRRLRRVRRSGGSSPASDSASVRALALVQSRRPPVGRGERGQPGAVEPGVGPGAHAELPRNFVDPSLEYQRVVEYAPAQVLLRLGGRSGDHVGHGEELAGVGLGFVGIGDFGVGVILAVRAFAAGADGRRRWEAGSGGGGEGVSRHQHYSSGRRW